MKGPFRRIRFRRRPSAEAPQETQATVVAPPEAGAMTQPLPAGVTPQDVAPIRPTFRNRGRLRRRLRYLRRVRELGFRDLGGLVFDLHRFGRRADELVLGKLAALRTVDHEMRALERALDQHRDIIELREPGIAACARCGALHGSEARFCPACGTPVEGPLAFSDVGEGPHPPAPTPGAEVRPLHAAGPAGATPVSAALWGDGGEPPAPGTGAVAAQHAAGEENATGDRGGGREGADAGGAGSREGAAAGGQGAAAHTPPGDEPAGEGATGRLPAVEPADRQS
jgi:hypothetical protein